jgi:hypothetical protein
MHIITRFLIWLLGLAESKIAQRNIKLNEDLKEARRAWGERDDQLRAEILRLTAQRNKLMDLRTVVTSDNMRATQDKFNQLKRHGRALRYSIGQACEEIEKIAKTLKYFRLGHPLDRVEAASKLREITRQMRALGCIPPDSGSIPAKSEDFISDFHPSMLDDDPVDGFKPAKEIVGEQEELYGKPGHVVVAEALDGVQDLIDRGRVKLNTHSPREPFKPSKAPFKFGGW